jgi:uncharacterized RDD family membrane protein YckC
MTYSSIVAAAPLEATSPPPPLPPALLPPPHPLDEMWYVQGETAALGPYRGDAIAEMIGRSVIGPRTQVAKVGWREWTALADVAVFKSFLVDEGATPESALNAPLAQVRYAGFWIRLGAFALDYLIVLILFALAALLACGTVFVIAGSARAATEPMLTLAGLLSAASFCFGLFYYVYFPRSPWQATPGKRLCGIYITRVDGGTINGWLALGRIFAATLSLVPLCVGFFMVGWTRQKTALHDLVCGTRVVYGWPGAEIPFPRAGISRRLYSR